MVLKTVFFLSGVSPDVSFLTLSLPPSFIPYKGFQCILTVHLVSFLYYPFKVLIPYGGGKDTLMSVFPFCGWKDKIP